jgi:sugar O-acyltransferase (sialic acid O-acetyltransferase NeuD family)
VKLLIYGSKDFGRLLRELICQSGHEFLGFVDDFDPAGSEAVGPYTEALRIYPPAAGIGMVMAIGYKHLDARQELWDRVRSDGYETPVIAHQAAVIAPSARIGAGSVLMAGAIVDAFTDVESCCVLWPGAVINHDCRIGANSFISPGAVICGFVNIGRSCFIGAGAVVVDHRSVPDRAFVKARALYK